LIGRGEGSTETVKDLPKLAQTTYLEKDGKKIINSLHFKTRAGGAWARVIIFCKFFLAFSFFDFASFCRHFETRASHNILYKKTQSQQAIQQVIF